MKVNRVEQQVIRKSHPMWKVVDEYCYKSKNLYNYANYVIRQEFINNGKWIRGRDLDKLLQKEDCYKELGSQAAQRLLDLLDKNWKSFFVAIKDWKRNKDKYLGRPRLPKYKPKDGRQILILKNIQCSINNEIFRISFKPFKGYSVETNAKGRLIQCRFVPRGSDYVMEIVYEIEVPEITNESKNIVAIDLGIDNFVTMTNNIGLQPIVIKGGIIKSINQYYNKRKAKLQSELKLLNNKHWSHHLEELTSKRFNRIKSQIHLTSKRVIDYCIKNGIDTIVCGYNKEWKQESQMSKKTNQNFIGIPYDMLIQQLAYKCENVGIRFIFTEESYTSGTSFLDGELPIKDNYNKKRRIHRGLFVANDGRKINADVNGSYQIMRKVFPNTSAEGIEGIGLYPTTMKIA